MVDYKHIVDYETLYHEQFTTQLAATISGTCSKQLLLIIKEETIIYEVYVNGKKLAVTTTLKDAVDSYNAC